MNSYPGNIWARKGGKEGERVLKGRKDDACSHQVFRWELPSRRSRVAQTLTRKSLLSCRADGGPVVSQIGRMVGQKLTFVIIPLVTLCVTQHSFSSCSFTGERST